MDIATTLAPLLATGLHVDLWGARAVEFFEFKYDFVIWAVIASVVVSACCATVGVFLVLRRMSLLGDATGHATLPGVAIAFLISGTKSLPILLLGALSTAMTAAFITSWLSRRRDSRPDAAIAITLAAFFALGVVLFSIAQRSSTGMQAGLNTFLFGNATGITGPQVKLILIISVLVITFVIAVFRPLSIRIFDQTFAMSTGIRTGLLDIAFIMLISVTVVIAIECLGVVLVSAMLITPASAALFLTNRLGWACLCSAVIGGISGFAGIFLSYLQEGFSSGPMIVIVATGIFLLCFIVGPRGGLWSRYLERRTADV